MKQEEEDSLSGPDLDSQSNEGNNNASNSLDSEHVAASNKVSKSAEVEVDRASFTSIDDGNSFSLEGLTNGGDEDTLEQLSSRLDSIVNDDSIVSYPMDRQDSIQSLEELKGTTTFESAKTIGIFQDNAGTNMPILRPRGVSEDSGFGGVYSSPSTTLASIAEPMDEVDYMMDYDNLGPQFIFRGWACYLVNTFVVMAAQSILSRGKDSSLMKEDNIEDTWNGSIPQIESEAQSNEDCHSEPTVSLLVLANESSVNESLPGVLKEDLIVSVEQQPPAILPDNNTNIGQINNEPLDVAVAADISSKEEQFTSTSNYQDNLSANGMEVCIPADEKMVEDLQQSVTNNMGEGLCETVESNTSPMEEMTTLHESEKNGENLEEEKNHDNAQKDIDNQEEASLEITPQDVMTGGVVDLFSTLVEDNRIDVAIKDNDRQDNHSASDAEVLVPTEEKMKNDSLPEVMPVEENQSTTEQDNLISSEEVKQTSQDSENMERCNEEKINHDQTIREVTTISNNESESIPDVEQEEGQRNRMEENKCSESEEPAVVVNVLEDEGHNASTLTTSMLENDELEVLKSVEHEATDPTNNLEESLLDQSHSVGDWAKHEQNTTNALRPASPIAVTSLPSMETVDSKETATISHSIPVEKDNTVVEKVSEGDLMEHSHDLHIHKLVADGVISSPVTVEKFALMRSSSNRPTPPGSARGLFRKPAEPNSARSGMDSPAPKLSRASSKLGSSHSHSLSDLLAEEKPSPVLFHPLTPKEQMIPESINETLLSSSMDEGSSKTGCNFGGPITRRDVEDISKKLSDHLQNHPPVSDVEYSKIMQRLQRRTVLKSFIEPKTDIETLLQAEHSVDKESQNGVNATSSATNSVLNGSAASPVTPVVLDVGVKANGKEGSTTSTGNAAPTNTNSSPTSTMRGKGRIGVAKLRSLVLGSRIEDELGGSIDDFEAARKQAQEVADRLQQMKAEQQRQLREKEEAKKKKQEEDARREAELAARFGKARSLGFSSIKAGLKKKEYRDFVERSPVKPLHTVLHSLIPSHSNDASHPMSLELVGDVGNVHHSHSGGLHIEHRQPSPSLSSAEGLHHSMNSSTKTPL
eukprot:scaffold906_cov157-Ochromonas_danica.AAC.4